MLLQHEPMAGDGGALSPFARKRMAAEPRAASLGLRRRLPLPMLPAAPVLTLNGGAFPVPQAIQLLPPEWRVDGVEALTAFLFRCLGDGVAIFSAFLLTEIAPPRSRPPESAPARTFFGRET